CRLAVRRGHVYLPAPVRRGSRRDAAAARARRPAGGNRRRARVRRPARTVAGTVGAVGSSRPPRRGEGRRGRLVRGRDVPRRVDPPPLRGVAAGAASAGVAGGGGRGRTGRSSVARWRDRDVGTQDVRPAFYALRPGGWRDYVTLLHPPYTLWHLSYVAVGAALAPRFHLDRLVWALASFFLAMGVAAHALDELHGRPLRTAIPKSVLVSLAVAALAGATAIGVGAAAAWGW